MFDELDTVVLKHDMKERGLKRGDLGTVVHAYKDKRAMEIEFVDASGKTVALLILKPDDVRPMARNEILHARDFVAAMATG